MDEKSNDAGPALDERIAAELAALRRARIRAVEIATRTGTAIVEADGDRPVLIWPTRSNGPDAEGESAQER